MKIGPFNVRLQSEIQSVQEGIIHLYSDYPLLLAESFSDFFVRIYRPPGFRRYVRKQSLFALDGYVPFKPLPYDQALPFFEWGLNWCISSYMHQFLIIHAAVVEKNSKALILPGAPGSGKSTLCAALIQSGWRLLSDELTLVDCSTGKIFPLPRPVSLKNESIDLVRTTFSQVEFSNVVHDTLKGTVSLLKPPKDSVVKAYETVQPYLVVFPQYAPQSKSTLTALSKARAFMKLADLSFNYSVLGLEGFQVMGRLAEQCQHYDFSYSGDFDEASRCFETLLRNC